MLSIRAVLTNSLASHRLNTDMFFRWYHGFFGVLNAIAILVSLVLSLGVLLDYFSYFTVLSNILITIIFLYFAFGNLKMVRKNKLVNIVYPAATVYMTITGIVFWTILHGGKALTVDVQWISLMMHGVMPIAVFLGWILFPVKTKLRAIDAFMWSICLLVFGVYTSVRGAIIHWYPYPFFNPVLVGGYAGVFSYIAGIMVLSFVIGICLIEIARRRN